MKRKSVKMGGMVVSFISQQKWYEKGEWSYWNITPKFVFYISTKVAWKRRMILLEYNPEICLLYFNTICRKKDKRSYWYRIQPFVFYISTLFAGKKTKEPTGIEYYSFLVFTTHFLTPPFICLLYFNTICRKKDKRSYWNRIQPFCLLYFNTIWRKKDKRSYWNRIQPFCLLYFNTICRKKDKRSAWDRIQPFCLLYFNTICRKKDKRSAWNRIQPFVFYISTLFAGKKTKDPPGIEYYSFLVFTTHFLTPFHLSFFMSTVVHKKKTNT